MIHTTIGVCANGTWKINGVASEDLAAHIKYNVNNRFGRALFLDGLCIYPGNLDKERIEYFEGLFESSESFKMTKVTRPYH